MVSRPPSLTYQLMLGPGGELFDHILANRYLKEKDAQKLFAQLVSGVDYLHKKHIVHRDLKLENLLLDKHRNIIITDFGFANRFDHAADDLMATSCGSPCYAAPELVVSEGLYVGSAVDIWSCGVILYAMLSGYLPYDDDPANPDGDNINLLYKYIMNTKLNFPDHMTAQAKHLLQIMLVPDPEYRCRIEHIMQHPWLSGQRDFFDKTVEEQEHSFQENMYRKSQVAKRELGERKRIQQEAKDQKAMQRSQSSLPGTAVTASLLEQRRAKEPRHHSTMPGATTMPEYLSNAGSRSPPLVAAARPPLAIHPPVPAASHTSPVIADTPVVVSPDTAPSPSEVPPPSAPVPTTPPRKRAGSIPPTSITPKAQILASKQSDLASLAGYSTMAVENEPMDVEPSPEARPPMSANKNRHTIQVEYDGEASYEKMTEVYEAKRAARSPQDEGSPKASGASSLVPLASSDIEMESVSSESGHARERRSESPAGLVTSEAPSPDASQVLTPLATTPPATAILEAAPIRSAASTAPTTPSKQAQSIDVGESTGSPSTPRAAANTVQADLATPRGDSSNVATPKASLQQPSKRLESPAQAAASVASSEPIPEGKSADLTSSGLPKVPPPKRDRNRKGMSLDKFGLARLLGQAGSSLDVSRPPSSGGSAATIQAAQNEVTQGPKRTSLMRPRTADVDSIKDKKTSRRRTFQQMVNRSVRHFGMGDWADPVFSSLSPRDGKPAAFTPVTPAVTPLAPRDMNPTPLSQGTQSPPMIIDGEGIQPQVMHERGLSSPSIVTVDAFSTQPAEDAQGHKTASSSAAKKVMDWFRRKSLAKDTLVNLKSAGIKSDSLSSFVRVSNGPARGPQPMAGSMANLAMSSTSSIAHTAQGTPNITVTDPAPVTEPVIDYTTSLKEMPESVRIRLGPAGSKINVVVPPAATSTASLLSPSRAGSMPIPSRSKSHHPADTAAASATSTVPPFKAAFRPTSTRSADDAKMRVHTGLVDQTALSSRTPAEVLAEVLRVLHGMGMEIKKENEFRLRCTRVRRRKAGATTGLGLGSVMSIGSGTSPFSLMSSASTGRVRLSPSSSSAMLMCRSRPTPAVCHCHRAHQ